MDENLLLLWKENEHSDKLFLTKSDPNSPSLRQGPVTSSSPRGNTPTSVGRKRGTKLFDDN